MFPAGRVYEQVLSKIAKWGPQETPHVPARSKAYLRV